MKVSKEEFIKTILLLQDKRRKQKLKEYMNPTISKYKYDAITYSGNKKAKKRLTGYPMGKIYN